MHAFQDQMPWNHCWGCGPGNEGGLQLKSTWEDDAAGVAVARFTPDPAYMAGPEHVLNGGIIATLLDCHSICTAIAHTAVREDRSIGSSPTIWFVTGTLEVSYLRPTPIDRELLVRAEVGEVRERRTTVSTAVLADGEECARAEVVAVRVPPEWLEPPGNHARTGGVDR